MEWRGVIDVLEQHPVVTRDARSLIVAIRASGHGVRLRAELVRAFDEDWLLVIAPICPAARASLTDALGANMRLAVAAHAIEQGWLVLRATHPLAGLEVAMLERIVRCVSEEAVRLRAIYRPDDTTVRRAVGHFSE